MSVTVTQSQSNVRDILDENVKRVGIKGKQIIEYDNSDDIKAVMGYDAKNLIINGDFNVWQRGTSLTPTGNFEVLADRWMINSPEFATMNVTQEIANVENFAYSMKVETNFSGTNNVNVLQRLEADQFYEGQVLTISCYIRASRKITHRFGRIHDGFNWVTDYELIEISPDWQKFQTTVTIEGLNSSAPYIAPYIQAQLTSTVAGEWIEITGFQMEEGYEATDFENRHINTEIELCQRYFQKSGDLNSDPTVYKSNGLIVLPSSYNTSGNISGQSFNTTMRSSPSITLYSSTGAAGVVRNLTDKVASAQNISTTGFTNVAITGGSSASFVFYHYTASSEL